MAERDTVEDRWSAELGVPVMIREWQSPPEYDLYCDGVFHNTFIDLEALERWLERYVCVRDGGA